MEYEYNIVDKPVQPKLILAKPNKNKIDLISNAIDLEIQPFFNSISELKFKIYKESNGKLNKCYDKIVPMCLIEAKGIAWFQIKNAKETREEKSKAIYKEVICLTLENDLISKKIDNINGVFSLYDNSEPELSLLHIIAQSCSWKIGTVDSSLLGMWRYFQIDSMEIYQFLTGQVAKSFECIFQFDTYNKTINVKKLSNIGEMTNIIISDKNVLKDYVKQEDLDKIVTKMRVRGATNADGTVFDIRSVNFGLDYIINIDYYLNSEWMSQGLVTAYTNYKNKLNSYVTQNTNLINTLKQYQADLTTLNSELVNLQSDYNAANTVCLSYRDENGKAPLPSDSGYALYQSSLSTANTISGQINAKKAQITNKQNQIDSVKNSLNTISYDVSITSNFTEGQIDELDNYLRQGEDYIDETFVTTDNTTEEEALEMKLQLLQNALNELARISRPQYTITTTLSNLLTLQDNRDAKISFKSLRDKFVTGNMITLKYSNEFMVGVRLMSMKLNYSNPTDIDVTFSDKSRLDDELIRLAEIISQSNRTSNTVSYEKIGWNESSRNTSEFKSFKNGMLNLAINALKTNDNQEPIIDNFGIHMRKFLPETNQYSPYQGQITNNQLLFTNDAWNSTIGGIGVFTDGNGVKSMAVFADVIAGNLLMGEKLWITNKSGTYSINDDGLTATQGIYSVGINPSTPGEILNVKVNGVNQFYIDTVTQALTFRGRINGGSINIGSGKFVVDSNGNAIVTGAITATSGNIGGFTLDQTQLTSGTGNKFMRISPYSTAPGTNNYSTDVGAIDLGRTSDGLDTLIHLRSDGYARFGLNSLNGSVRFNYKISDEENYSLYTRYFRIETNGFVKANYIESLKNEELWLIGNNGVLLGSDSSDTTIYSAEGSVLINTYGGYFKYNGSHVLTASNYSSHISTSSITPSLTSAGNIDFAGSENACSVNFAQNTFALKEHTHSGYASSSHSHSEYATSSQLSALASRVSALENA